MKTGVREVCPAFNQAMILRKIACPGIDINRRTRAARASPPRKREMGIVSQSITIFVAHPVYDIKVRSATYFQLSTACNVWDFSILENSAGL